MTKTENRHSEQAQNRRGTVRAVCISTARGTEKTPVEKGHFLVDFGIEGDAHGGKWHRFLHSDHFQDNMKAKNML